MKINIPEKILKSVSPQKILYNEPMGNHTSIGTGGQAAALIIPDTLPELCFVLEELKANKNHVIIGNGLNVLVSDSGYNGIIIKTSKIKGIERYGKYLTVFLGETLSAISKAACNEGLTGMEWAAADRGTLGAAIYTNASHFDANITDSIYIVEVLTKSGEIIVLNESLFSAPSYKNEIAKKGYIVLRAILQLDSGDEYLMRRHMDGYIKSAKELAGKAVGGEVFTVVRKHIDAAEIIEEIGGCGKAVGGASICTKNPNYIINNESATSNDVYTLIDEIIFAALQKKGVQLKHNMRLIGKF